MNIDAEYEALIERCENQAKDDNGIKSSLVG